jgi:tRNA threonylcarbamoyladenosine modification (KEOPS) complex Cgi121 subunit
MEILLYASGERQLKLAIPKMGIKKNTKKIAFILISKKDHISNYLIQKLLNYLSLKRSDDVLNIDEKNIKKFGINEKEIKTVSTDNYEKLIIEKVALVDIIK